MKILFLGTGTTASRAANTSFVVDDSVIFDMGGGTCKQLIKYNDLKISHCIVSHYHPDHFADVSELLIYSTFMKPTALTFVGDGIESRVRGLCGILDTMVSEDTKFKDIKDQSIDFGMFKLTAKTLGHGDSFSNAYILEKDGKKIGYTGDTRMCNELHAIIPLCDKWIIECTYDSEKNPSEWHLSKQQVEELALLNSNKTFYAVHRRNVSAESKCKNIIFPEDGDVVEI